MQPIPPEVPLAFADWLELTISQAFLTQLQHMSTCHSVALQIAPDIPSACNALLQWQCSMTLYICTVQLNRFAVQMSKNLSKVAQLAYWQNQRMFMLSSCVGLPENRVGWGRSPEYDP